MWCQEKKKILFQALSLFYSVALYFAFPFVRFSVPKPQQLWEISPSCQHFDLIVESVNHAGARCAKSNSCHSLLQLPLRYLPRDKHRLSHRTEEPRVKLTSATDLCSIYQVNPTWKHKLIQSNLFWILFNVLAPSSKYLHGRCEIFLLFKLPAQRETETVGISPLDICAVVLQVWYLCQTSNYCHK